MPNAIQKPSDIQVYIVREHSINILDSKSTTTVIPANLLQPTTKHSDNATDSSADRLDRPVASMDRVFTVLARRAVNERTCGAEASEVALNILEWRTVLGREVIPHTAVMGVHGVLDLVDVAILGMVGNLDWVCISRSNCR